MSDPTIVDLGQAIRIHQCMSEYRDTAYLRMLRQMNEREKELLKDDLGSEFVCNCGRDLAGEIVRNYFDTSDYNITVDQMFFRIAKFSYENDYDPIGKNQELRKKVYNYNDISSSTLDSITERLDDAQTKLFEKEVVVNERTGKSKKVYKDNGIIERGKDQYVGSRKEEDGTIYDEYTGKAGEYITDKNGNRRRRQEVDHVQAAATATYNERYIKKGGVDALKEMMNSADNFAMMDKIANESKGDVRVFDKDGNDISHRATPEQYADAICKRWEESGKESTKQELKDKGYLNEDGKVPKSVRKKLEDNIRHSQNKESTIILKNTKYGKVAEDAAGYAVDSFDKMLIGQIIYYAAPPLIFEIRRILQDKKDNKLDSVLERIAEAAKKIGDYVFSHLKDIFKNLAEGFLKKFIKSFFDILIKMVKATVKKILGLAKNLVMSTCDAIRIIATPGATAAEKADAVFNLYGITITNFAVEILFEFLEKGAHLPAFLLKPLQVLTSVVCTNLTMLILQKADLFDVRFGFRMNNLQRMFEEERAVYEEEASEAMQYSQGAIKQLIEKAREDCLNIYYDLEQLDPHTQSARGGLQQISDMFHMNIDFENEWLSFIGIEPPIVEV